MPRIPAAREQVRIQLLGSDLWAISLYDVTWRTWINCYLLRRGATIALIDSGKPEQSGALSGALASLGVRPGEVTDLVLTHGHLDHVGGASMMSNATCHLHALDLPLIADRGLVCPSLQSPVERAGTVHLGNTSLEYLVTGHHTPGSWVLWDPGAEALFSGDFICWFNERLPADGNVKAGLSELEARLLRFAGWWTSSPRFGDPAAFRQAVTDLVQRWKPQLLCSGHGPVLEGDVTSFLLAISRGGR